MGWPAAPERQRWMLVSTARQAGNHQDVHGISGAAGCNNYFRTLLKSGWSFQGHRNPLSKVLARHVGSEVTTPYSAITSPDVMPVTGTASALPTAQQAGLCNTVCPDGTSAQR